MQAYDNWLSDQVEEYMKECEPDEEKCIGCSQEDCQYWLDYNEENEEGE